ncbi:hypothetical protein IGI39_003418 [Enterococcus sp. AZ135]|uniref:sugar-binding transcriptional regulator n=1 Tax=unclassified Enterococcus TaxID=2608891 RepID=UPI003F227DFE
MQTQRKRLLSKVGYLYYVENKSQNEIANELEMNRTTVSRMIKQVQNEGMVEIKLKDIPEELFKLEALLQEKFEMKHLVIVGNQKDNSEQQKNEQLLTEAAYYLSRIIKSENTVGITSGKTLADLTELVKSNKITQATFVPLIGSPEKTSFDTHVNTIINNLSKAFKGTPVFMNASLVQESELLKEQIQCSKNFDDLNHYWKNLDIALVGIGNPFVENASQWREILSKIEIDELKEKQIVGDCCGNFYDIAGNIIKNDLYYRTIGIGMEGMFNVPNSIGVARSIEKVPSIIGALRSGAINTLITDEETAQEILKTCE